MPKDVLEYIWIENFRNIKEQGFNLSEKYTYSFDSENMILKRKINNHFIDDFYGDKIEFNAIVGMNGAGKTSILSAIVNCFSRMPGTIITKTILAFRSGKAIFIYNNPLKKICFQTVFFNDDDETITIENNTEGLSDWECIFHSDVIDYQMFSPELIELKGQNISTSSLMYEFSNDNPSESYEWDDYSGKPRNAIIQFLSNNFKKQITFLTEYATKSGIKWISSKEDNNKSSKLKWPEYASVFVKDISTICNELTWQYNHVYLNIPDLNNETFHDLLYPMDDGQNLEGNTFEQFKAKVAPGIIAVVLSISCSKNIGKNSIFPLFLNCILRFIVNYKHDQLEKVDDINLPWEISYETVKELIENKMFNKHDLDVFKESSVFQEIQNYGIEDSHIQECRSLLNESASMVDAFVELLNKGGGREKEVPFSFNEFKFYILGVEPVEIDDNYIDISLNALFEEYRAIGLLYDFLEFSWNLSSGEQARMDLFSRIYEYYEDKFKYIEKNELHNLLILLDEADMLLHPEWQRNYVDNLKEFLENLFENVPIHIQVIISTHSPIMLSDIPKQNILFLGRRDGRITEVKGSQTFSSNIFDLYRNAFFIEESGIGTFAEKKLKNILHEIREKDNDEEGRIQKYISCIGDDFIRGKIMLEYKKKFGVMDEKNKRIAELEKELAELKKEQKND